MAHHPTGASHSLWARAICDALVQRSAPGCTSLDWKRCAAAYVESQMGRIVDGGERFPLAQGVQQFGGGQTRHFPAD